MSAEQAVQLTAELFQRLDESPELTRRRKRLLRLQKGSSLWVEAASASTWNQVSRRLLPVALSSTLSFVLGTEVRRQVYVLNGSLHGVSAAGDRPIPLAAICRVAPSCAASFRFIVAEAAPGGGTDAPTHRYCLRAASEHEWKLWVNGLQELIQPQ